MAVVKRTARVLVAVLAAVLVTVLIVTAFAVPAHAENVPVSNKTHIQIKTHVADKLYAGTDSDIYFKVYYVDGKSDSIKLDKSKYNDFERNDWDTYHMDIGYPMWYVTGFGLKNSGSDAMCLAYISATMWDPNTAGITSVFTCSEPGSKWIEKSEHKFNVSFSKRVLSESSYRAFKDAFSKKVYVTAADSGKTSVEWTPALYSDGYLKKDANSYNPYNCSDAPSLTYTVRAVTSSNSWVNALSGDFTPIMKEYNKKGYQIGFEYDRKKVYDDMTSAGYNVLAIAVNWEFPSRSTSGVTSKSYTYYIYRQNFELGNAEIKTNWYTALKDNYFFNSGSSSLRISLPVKGGLYHSNYDPASIASSFHVGQNGYIKLFYGNGADDYFTPTSISSSGTNILLDFDLTKKQYQAASSGFKLVMKEVYASPGSNYPGAGEYPSYDVESFSQGSPRTVSLGGSITLGNASYYRDLSKYKFDNIAPSITVKEDGWNGSGELSGAWQQNLTIATWVDGNEQLFPRLNPNGENGNERERGLFEIGLFKADGKTTVPIKGSLNTGFLRVPVKSGTKTAVIPMSSIESSDLILRVTGYDFAGNKFTRDITGVHLDTIAPQLGLTRQDRGQASDGSKSLLFKFNIKEGSGTGRVNYCFVPNGSAIPPETGWEAVSGEVVSTVGKWAYIEQSGMANAAAVLKMLDGQVFDGNLYYYAVDAAGNRTTLRSFPVSVTNEAANCEASVAAYDHPLPDYNVTFIPAANCEVYYRYSKVNDDGSTTVVRNYVKYDGKTNPGLSDGASSVSGAATVASKLNGSVILEYKVENTKSMNVVKFEGGLGIPLVFDNTDPVITITQNTKGSSLASHTFSVSASDISGVVSASYKVTPVGSTTAAVSGTIDITAGSGVLNTVLNTSAMNLANGNYELSVTAVDSNGASATAVSDPFSVRTSAPAASVKIGGAAPAEINYVKAYDYTLTLDVSDSFAGTPGTQYVYWRASADGSGYTPWQLLSALTPGSGALTKQAALNTPLALNEGLNDVYIQLACAEATKNLSKEVPAAGSILTMEPLHFMLDTEDPSLRWNMISSRNNSAVIGTLTVSDDLDDALEVSCSSLDVVITPSESDGVYDVVYKVPEGGGKIASFTLTATDDCGNTADVTVSTDLLDIDAPTVSISNPSYTVNGEQKDASLTVTVNDFAIGDVSFSFRNEAKYATAESDKTSDYATVTDNGNGSYTVELKGFTGSVDLGVTASDDLGNSRTVTKSGIEVAYPDSIVLKKILSQPMYAIDTAPVTLEFNIPVVLGKDEAEAAGKQDGTLSKVAGIALVTNAAVETKSAFTVWAAGEFGAPQAITVEPDTIFGKNFNIGLELKQSADGVESTVTNSASSMLVSGTHFADPSDPGDTDKVYTAAAILSVDPPVTQIVHYTDGYYETPIYMDSLTVYSLLTEGDPRLYKPAEDNYILNYTQAGINSDPVITNDGFSYDDYDSKGTLFVVDDESSVVGGGYLSDFPFYYEKLVYSLDGQSSANQIGGSIVTGFVHNDMSRYIQYWESGELYPDNIDGVMADLYIRRHDDPEHPSCVVTPFSQYDIWLNKAVDINTKLIVTGPSIEYSWKQSNMAPEAALEISANGNGAEITKLKLLKKDKNGSVWSVVDSWTPDTVIAPPSISVDENGETISGASAIYTDENGTYKQGAAALNRVLNTTDAALYTYCIYAENEGGLSAVSEEFDVTIYENPIQAGDFSVQVLIDKAGDGIYTADDGTSFAHSAKAVVVPSAEGEARGITVTNCSGKMEYVLDEHAPVFTFGIADNYGYTTEAAVSFDRFDNVAPALSYTLANTGKTNQPYGIMITAADDASGSGIKSVEMKLAGQAQTLTPGGGSWTGTIAKNGSYLITVLDNIGNRSQKTFTVTNIDTVAPAIASLDRSVLAGTWTQDSVDVTINFSKPNVTITSAERTSGRFTLDKDNARLTFTENGTASVFFRDDYGNTGAAIVTVDNIYDQIPTLKAIPVLSDDELSVTVTFEQQEDGNGVPLDKLLRDLTEFTVMQNGTAYNAADARFILRDNGNYTFTVIDQAGLTQMITITVTDIDRAAPKITEVSWNYVYVKPDGTTSAAIHSISNVTGAAYVIADDIYPRTYNPVTVTVKTDAQTSIMGAQDAQKQTDHSLVYNENGMFIFNLEKANGLSTNYGVDVEVIDKDKPVITLNGGSQLMYVEGKATGSIRAMVTSFSAIDTFRGIETDLTAKVAVDFGGLDVDNVENNTFDKSRPYTVTYTVKDAAGNQTTVTRMVLLIGINDVLVTVNGELPDASFMAEVQGGSVRLDMVNFSGKVYCNYAQGMNSFGQMKTKGEFITPNNGSFTVSGLETGWYTFFVQTEMRDYFNIYVYVK